MDSPKPERSMEEAMEAASEVADKLPKSLHIADKTCHQAADRIEQLEAEMREWEAECSSCMMLARKWMEAHDRLKAGKPYDLPKPADLPNAVKQLEAENKRLREALAFYGRPYSWRRSGMTMKGPQPSAAELDGGERARAVLSKAQEQSK